jgi:hypothetical protein
VGNYIIKFNMPHERFGDVLITQPYAASSYGVGIAVARLVVQIGDKKFLYMGGPGGK